MDRCVYAYFVPFQTGLRNWLWSDCRKCLKKSILPYFLGVSPVPVPVPRQGNITKPTATADFGAKKPYRLSQYILNLRES